MQQIKIKPLSKSVKLPMVKTEGSAGIDLSAFSSDGGPIVIKAEHTPDNPLTLHTGVAVEIPEHHVGFLTVRSSCGKHFGLANSVGIIDSDYRGEILAKVYNHHATDYYIEPGQDVLQLVVVPIPEMEIVYTNNLSETKRNTGGFGSTDK